MIYVASKTFRLDGFPVHSTWIDEAGQGETLDWADLWRRCVSEAATATALVVYAESTDVLKGALVEVGAALAAGRPVLPDFAESAAVLDDARLGKCCTR